MLKELVQASTGLTSMYLIVIITMLAVIIAMGMDLMFGWRKAKERGDARNSYAFSRTISKFALYEGVLIIGCCIDTLIHYVWAQLHESYYFVPIITCIVGIVLCIVEVWSMREKADAKTRNNLNNAIRLVAEAFPRDKAMDMIREALENLPKQEKDE